LRQIKNWATIKYVLCVYFESTESSYSAIEREKEIKGWSREKKDNLVNTMNPDWVNLAIELFG